MSLTPGYFHGGKNILEALDNARLTAVRRHILQNNKKVLRLGYRTIARLEPDDRDRPKDHLLVSLGGGAWIERNEPKDALARWLGYRRTGPRIADIAASLIKGLLLAERLKIDGKRIRKVK